MAELAEITIDVDTNNNGTYNIYMQTENSSGESYINVTADRIGEYVAGLIDALEEAKSGKSYSKPEKTTKTVLVYTDGYSIKNKTYPDYQTAKTAMEEEYKQYNNNTPGDEWDKISYIDDYDAILYAGSINVHIWNIMEI